MVTLAHAARLRLLIGSVGMVGLLGGALTALPFPADAGGPSRAAAPAAIGPCVVPLPDGDIVALARIPLEPWHRGHRGIDITAQVGAPVVAPADAVVEFVGHVVDRPVITVRHAGGMRTSLEPVVTDLEEGALVARGAVIGTVAEAPDHCEPGVCVHWGLRQGDAYVDPLTCVPGFGPVVLLPLTGG